MLEQRDYTLILDKSGSMGFTKAADGRSLWRHAEEGTLALAAKIHELDPDGITVYPFASTFKRYDNVTPDKVAQIFKENEPNGSTNLAGVLQDALGSYFQRKAAGKTQPNGELLIVVTDGAPDSQDAAAKVIVEATKKMDRDEELAIQFLQIGTDAGATAFLRYLDDDLVSKLGAKFDIVDTTTQAEAENMTFSELLLKTITD